MTTDDTSVREVRVSTFRVPTPAPEADGTATWDATELVVVQPLAGDAEGLGWSYCAAHAAAAVVRELLAPAVTGHSVLDVPGLWQRMAHAVRNAGRPGLVSMAMAAVDLALWDLKAKLLGLPLDRLLGRCRDTAPIYGSGGFVSLDDAELTAQLRHWTDHLGIAAVKIKVGERWGQAPDRDLTRARRARAVIGDAVELMVDANGGYTRGQARRLGACYDDLGVTWFEEPVSAEDLAGLAGLRTSLRCDIAAGEYADAVGYAHRMCAASAVDCLQLDVTRCAGITEWLRAAAVADAHGLQVSAHCAPSLHLAPALAVPNLRHVEYFADHERLEPMLFDGVPTVASGHLTPSSRLGNGMTLTGEAEQYRTGRGSVMTTTPSSTSTVSTSVSPTVGAPTRRTRHGPS
jgi:L-alanine-DL-glutamate epimerase-like enolase superfamily enzyme